MPKYCGVNGEVREITSQYTDINGEVREIVEEYCGVDGEVRKIFGGAKNLISMLGNEVTWYGGYYTSHNGATNYKSSNPNGTSNTTYCDVTESGIKLNGYSYHADTTSGYYYGLITLELDVTNIDSITLNYSTTKSSNVYCKITTTSLSKALSDTVTNGYSSVVNGGSIDVSDYTGIIWLSMRQSSYSGNVTVTITEMTIE